MTEALARAQEREAAREREIPHAHHRPILNYRGESQHAHVAVASLERLIVNAANAGEIHVIAVETDPGPTNPFTRAPMLYALGILVAGHGLDLPNMAAGSTRIFARHAEP